MRRGWKLGLTVTVLASCAHGPRVYSFQTQRPPDEAVDLLARRLGDQGHLISEMDRAAGVITTYWEDTGQREVEGGDGAHPVGVFVRYRVEVRTAGTEHAVGISQELERCGAEAFTITAREVVGFCEPMSGLRPEHQRALDQLGQSLSSALESRGGAS
jgi:hypothetical protein